MAATIGSIIGTYTERKMLELNFNCGKILTSSAASTMGVFYKK